MCNPHVCNSLNWHPYCTCQLQVSLSISYYMYAKLNTQQEFVYAVIPELELCSDTIAI